MATDFGTVLDECLARLEAGEVLDACLAEHPQYAAELSALLSVAASVQSLARPEPRPEAVSAGRAQMLSAARARKQAQALFAQRVPAHGRWSGALFGKPPAATRPVLRFALGLLLMLVVGANLVWVASAAATLPGDSLYPVKRALENTRLALTPGEQAREQFEEQLAARRRNQVQEMLERDRQGQIEILGMLQPEGNDRWAIGGLVVDIDHGTAIDSKLSAGALADAQVAGMKDRRILALSVHVLSAPVVPSTDPTPAASRRSSLLRTAGPRSAEPTAAEPTAALSTAASATTAPISQRSGPVGPPEMPPEMPGPVDGAKPSEAPAQKLEPAASEEVQKAPSSDRQPESTPPPANDSHARGTEASDQTHAPDRRPANMPASKEQAKAAPVRPVDHTSPEPAQSDHAHLAPAEPDHASELAHLRPVMLRAVQRENAAKPGAKPSDNGDRRDTSPHKAERPKPSHG